MELVPLLSFNSFYTSGKFFYMILWEFLKILSSRAFVRLDTDAGREGLAHNHSNMFTGVEGVPHQTHPTTSLWTLLCALGHSHAGIEKALPQTVPTTLEAYYCPKCLSMLTH